MDGIHLSDFFPEETVPQTLRPLLAAASPVWRGIPKFLLSGPEGGGLATLLFQFAYSCAQRGSSVLILALRDRLECAPPSLTPGLRNPSHPAWSNIHIKYLENGHALVRFATLLHLHPDPPDVILVMDLDRIVSIGESGPCTLATTKSGQPNRAEAELCRALALLIDSMEHISRVSGKPASVGATVTTSGFSEYPRSMHILQRWLPLVLICRSLGSSRNDTTFRLERLVLDITANSTQGEHWTIDYAADPELVVRAVYNASDKNALQTSTL